MKKRLAVENDDKASQWSITDLLPLHDRIGMLRHCPHGLKYNTHITAERCTKLRGLDSNEHAEA